MKTVVADASLSAAWFLKDECSAEAEKVLETLLAGKLIIWIPSLWFYEMSNLLLNAQRAHRMEASGVETALGLFDSLPLKQDSPDALGCRRIYRFASELHLSAYDATYLELADRLQIPLLSFDRKLVAACHSRGLKTS